jgi:hypothetical protein
LPPALARTYDVGMWYPRSWSELQALLGESEGPSIDFKSRLGSNEELAKDIAAMTVNGGLLLYGIDEDKETCVATELLPFPIAGIEEKIRSVAGSRISPTPDLQVEVIASPADASEGIVVVAIPASSLAPHQANGRFPSRRGRTTEYLEEREVERLYRQRAELSGPVPQSGELSGNEFVSMLSGMERREGTGRLMLVVRPAARDVSHPAGAWQENALSAAMQRAMDRQSPRVGNATVVQSFRVFRFWTPVDANGWGATNRGAGPGHVAPMASPQLLLAARLTYPARLSFEAFLGLEAGRQGAETLRSARELDIVYELVGMLSFSGEYFSDVEGGAHLLVELRLEGFNQARSQMTIDSSTTGDLEAAKLPTAPPFLLQGARTTASELRETPEEVARVLIERWLPPFYLDDRNLFTWVVPPG